LESLLRKEPSHCELFIFKALPATLLLAVAFAISDAWDKVVEKKARYRYVIDMKA
jgi:hypothetical protein